MLQILFPPRRGPGLLSRGLPFASAKANRRKAEKVATWECRYCGSGLEEGISTCTSCGGSTPMPLPVSPADGAEVIAARKTALMSAWYSGGFMGIHCYAAGRPFRGLLYGAGVFSILLPLLLPGIGLRSLSYTLTGLTALWVFDGVQIARGRFARR